MNGNAVPRDLRSSDSARGSIASDFQTPDCRFGLSARALRAELARGDAIRNDLSRRLAYEERLSRFQRCAMAIAAHDLGRPLGMIAAVLSSHARNAHSTTAQLWTGIGVDELGRLRGAFEDLAVAAARDGHQCDPVVHVDVSLGDLLRTAAEDWQFFALAKGLSFEVVASTLVIRSDPVLLRAIVENLISNAIRHSDTGGVRVGCRRRGGVVRIEVLDTGPGLGARHKAFIESSGPGAFDTMGSGLAIVREASTLLGHPLSVYASAGNGTRISVTVPRAG